MNEPSPRYFQLSNSRGKAKGIVTVVAETVGAPAVDRVAVETAVTPKATDEAAAATVLDSRTDRAAVRAAARREADDSQRYHERMRNGA